MIEWQGPQGLEIERVSMRAEWFGMLREQQQRMQQDQPDLHRDFSIMSTMWLRVELRLLEMITGSKSAVLSFAAHLELGGCMLLDLASRLHFPRLLLEPTLLIVAKECAEFIKMSPCSEAGWG